MILITNLQHRKLFYFWNWTESTLTKYSIYRRAINNLAYNEYTNAYFKCNKIPKLSYQYKLQVSNYVFQVLHSNIDQEIKSSLLINNQIHSHNTRTKNQMSILHVNRSETKHCVLHNGMITWNSLPNIFENIKNIYCHSLSVQYNTIQCYLSTECIQNQFFIYF